LDIRASFCEKGLARQRGAGQKMLDNPPVREPQARYPHFTPWPNRAERSFRSCAHATDYDGVHL
jgi:hypothetical protein